MEKANEVHPNMVERVGESENRREKKRERVEGRRGRERGRKGGREMEDGGWLAKGCRRALPLDSLFCLKWWSYSGGNSLVNFIYFSK